MNTLLDLQNNESINQSIFETNIALNYVQIVLLLLNNFVDLCRKKWNVESTKNCIETIVVSIIWRLPIEIFGGIIELKALFFED